MTGPDAAGAPDVLVGEGPEPLLVRCSTPGRPAPWVVMIHSVGENRTGNNYWQARAATALACAGFTAVRFDLSGYGESLGPKDVAVWREQIEGAVRHAVKARATAVFVTARGLHCALLGQAPAGTRRIALFPPEPAELDWWRHRRAEFGAAGAVEASATMDADERAFWEACGAESNLVGGLEIPPLVLDELISPADETRWDLVVTAAHEDRRPRTNRIVCGRDPLTRLESDRAGLEHLLIRWLRGQLPGHEETGRGAAR